MTTPKRTNFRTPIPASIYQKGDYVWVKYGKDGQQLARIVASFTSGRATHSVIKYRQNSRRWTSTVYIYPHEILGLASAKAVARATPPRS